MSYRRTRVERTKQANLRLICLLAGLLAAVALAAPSVSSAAVSAKEAESFVESIGVNIHTPYADTPYFTQFETIKQRLAELGVHHVRDVLQPDDPEQYQALNELANMGVHSTLILDYPQAGQSLFDELIAALKDHLAGATEAVEGPNEYSTRGFPDWKSELVAYQQRLYEEIKGDPSLSSLPVVGPSIVHGDQALLGDISGFLDYGNIHSYPEGNAPEYKMGLNVERAEINSGSKPIMATETGYTTATGWTPMNTGENRPVPEDVMATYMPRLFFEYFSRHIARTYSYELLDEQPDPELDDREANFGLLRNDLSEKPAFAALRNTIEILEDPGPTFAPDPLSYTLSGATANLHSVLLEKRDGSFYLALWRIVSVWDPIGRTALEPPPEPVTLAVAPGLAAVAEYLPNSSSQPIWSAPETSEPLTIDVGPAVVIVKLTPAEADSASQLTSATSGLPAGPGEEISPAPHCVVPELRGRKLKVGRKKLKHANCRLGRVRGGPSRTVIKQNPKPGRILAPGSRVSVKLD